MNILDHISKSLETIFCVKILEFFYAAPDPGIFLTLDPGWKKFVTGIREKIPDPQHCIHLTLGLWDYFGILSNMIGSSQVTFSSHGVIFRSQAERTRNLHLCILRLHKKCLQRI
jgi:hypothetical protein